MAEAEHVPRKNKAYLANTLAVGSGEDNGDNLYGDGEESISSCCCGSPVTTEWFVGLVVAKLESTMIS